MDTLMEMEHLSECVERMSELCEEKWKMSAYGEILQDCLDVGVGTYSPAGPAKGSGSSLPCQYPPESPPLGSLYRTPPQ